MTTLQTVVVAGPAAVPADTVQQMLAVGAPPWLAPFHPILAATNAAGNANRAYCQALPPLAYPMTIAQARIVVDITGGNISIGVVDLDATVPGTRVATTGTVALGAAGVQVIPFTAAYTLVPARRYAVCLALSSGAAAIRAAAASVQGGFTDGYMYRVDAAMPIPDPCFATDADFVRSFAVVLED